MTISINLGQPADIASYSDLIARAATWLDRDDLTTFMQTFISLTEADLNRRLRTPAMETIAYPAIANGCFVLPADCLQVRGVTVGGRVLDTMSPGQLLNEFGTRDGILTGCAQAFSISGRTVTLGPVGGEASAKVSYWQRIPSLNPAVQSNWLLAGHPDIYLYGTLAQAEAYIENPDRAAQWNGLYEGAVGMLMQAASKARWAGPIRQRGLQQVSGVRA